MTRRASRGSSDSPPSPSAPSSRGRDHLLIAVNGHLHTVRGAEVFLTLSTWLRDRLRLVGTKIVCSEGDCGACSVLVGSLENDRPSYRAIDSCIAFLYQLDRCHVITVDGLARSGAHHPAQTAMAEHFGSQCGYCTPGFVIALAALTEEERAGGGRLDESRVRVGLSGNLCRCTGYVQILESAAAIDPGEATALSELFDDGPIFARFREAESSVRLEHDGRALRIPASLDEALSERSDDPRLRIVAGATDVGVQHNKDLIPRDGVLHLRSDLGGFGEARVSEEGLRLGAGARWRDVEAIAREAAPELARVLEIFGGPQIRNVGTVGGNLVNASPIADSLPFFYVCEATLELQSRRGSRTVPVADFYLGYKQLDLAPDELLTAIDVPLPSAQHGELVRLIKVSRRRDLDISTFTAALWLRFGDRGRSRIEEARLALGGVAPTVVRVPTAEQVLTGAPFSEQTFRDAGERAASSIQPISDVRGEASYRRLLARNALLHLFHELRTREAA